MMQQEFSSIIHQSIPAAPASPLGWPPGISVFFALDGKFPGVGTLELTNPPGWVDTATFFIDRTVE